MQDEANNAGTAGAGPTTWNYPLPPRGEVRLYMPRGAELLGVDTAGPGAARLTARVDPQAPPERRRFLILAPGEAAPDGAVKVATWPAAEGEPHWRLFEVLDEQRVNGVEVAQFLAEVTAHERDNALRGQGADDSGELTKVDAVQLSPGAAPPAGHASTD